MTKEQRKKARQIERAKEQEVKATEFLDLTLASGEASGAKKEPTRSLVIRGHNHTVHPNHMPQRCLHKCFQLRGPESTSSIFFGVESGAYEFLRRAGKRCLMLAAMKLPSVMSLHCYGAEAEDPYNAAHAEKLFPLTSNLFERYRIARILRSRTLRMREFDEE